MEPVVIGMFLVGPQQVERQERAVASIEQDSFVRDVVDIFDATINESSIKPIQGKDT